MFLRVFRLTPLDPFVVAVVVFWPSERVELVPVVVAMVVAMVDDRLVETAVLDDGELIESIDPFRIRFVELPVEWIRDCAEELDLLLLVQKWD